MSKFSDRIGATKPKIQIQIGFMDLELRNCLWNVFAELLLTFREVKYMDLMTEEMRVFVLRIWRLFFKEPIDTIPIGTGDNLSYRGAYDIIREYYFKAPWYTVYNLLEFSASNYPTPDRVESFIKACNLVLQRELSGYRFVGKQIAQITSKEEIREIEEALVSPLKTVNLHLETAVKHFSNKTAPDYRNSIKESISAVEAICRVITNDKNATLGQALDKIEKKGQIQLQGALKKAFDALYGYTSGSEGIRHSLGLLEEPNLTQEEAKFMLVSCSAFINYLVTKASKAGIDFGQKNKGA